MTQLTNTLNVLAWATTRISAPELVTPWLARRCPPCFPGVTTFKKESFMENYSVHSRYLAVIFSLQWRHNERDGASNNQHLDCFFNRLFPGVKNTKAPRHWPSWGEPPVTGRFPSQSASSMENFSTWWRHHIGRTDKRHPVAPPWRRYAVFVWV